MTHLHTTASLRRGAVAFRLIAVSLVALGIAIAIFAVVRTRCCAPPPVTVNPPPVDRPADFSLDFRAQTAYVSPAYFHRWRLQVASDGAAQMTFTPGYRDDAPTWSASWSIPAATRDSLWADFRRGALWMVQPEKPVPPDEIRGGGGSSVLTVTAAGRTVELADDRRDAFAVPAERLVTRVGALIPDSLMQQFKARQAAMPVP